MCAADLSSVVAAYAALLLKLSTCKAMTDLTSTCFAALGPTVVVCNVGTLRG